MSCYSNYPINYALMPTLSTVNIKRTRDLISLAHLQCFTHLSYDSLPFSSVGHYTSSGLKFTDISTRNNLKKYKL